MAGDFLFDIVSHYMHPETEKKEAERIKTAEKGSIIFTTYSFSNITREVFTALCDKNEVKFKEEFFGNTVKYRKM